MISYPKYCTGFGSGGTDPTRRAHLARGAGLVLCLGLVAGAPNLHAAARCSIETVPSPAVITAGDSVTFTGKVTGKPPATYDWAFDGGNPPSSNAETVSVSYASAGSYTATLNGTNGRGDSCTADVGVTVQPVQQQVCNISVTPSNLNFGTVSLGNTVTRSANVTNNGGAACNVTLAVTAGVAFTAVPPLSFNLTPSNSRSVSVDFAPSVAGLDEGNLAISTDDPTNPQTVNVGLSGTGADVVACVPADLNISINSTSQNGCPDGTIPQQPIVDNATSAYSVLAINDLGMHCGDLDTRISSILPPFQVLLTQVIEKGSSPTLNPNGVEVYYSAASNPNDPILALDVFEGVMGNGDTYKTNFWNTVINTGVYNAFYPFDINGMMTEDLGLPVPNLETLYIDNGSVIPYDTANIAAVQHAMPGIPPYVGNVPQLIQEHYLDKPFFVHFPFGYVAADVNWFEGAGIPFAAFDDNGRENAYPLVRVQVTTDGNVPNATASNVVASVDTVLPISGEASCTNCHTETGDYESVEGVPARTQDPITALGGPDSPLVAYTLDDPDSNMPPRVSLEYAADINVLRLHDLKHGARYVNTNCDNVPEGENCLDPTNNPPTWDPCTISEADPNGSDSCLTNLARVQNKPVVCQVCHYTPALDLAHVGPQAGPPGTDANGRNQVAHESNSRVMHHFHGQFTNLFTPIPLPAQNPDGSIQNQGARVAAMENNCYQCHPGTNVKCLRGAMFDGDMLCSDCHGSISQVGEDFSAGVSPENPGAFDLTTGNFYDPGSGQPRVPWANEPGCGSCHTGDYNTNLAGAGNVRVNLADINGNEDGIRLRQAWRNGDQKATPIVPTNKRFAEPAVPATFNGFANPGAGNPQLYRVSTGHGGVMCEGCHGATHAEFDSDAPGPLSNDDVTAEQLQGHPGTIIECQTCHDTTFNDTNTIDGPHGMHPVGNDTSVSTGSTAGPRISFVDGGHENVNRSGCSDCHGPGRNGNQGTVLSIAKKDRRLNGQTITAGTPVGCGICHD